MGFKSFRGELNLIISLCLRWNLILSSKHLYQPDPLIPSTFFVIFSFYSGFAQDREVCIFEPVVVNDAFTEHLTLSLPCHILLQYFSTLAFVLHSCPSPPPPIRDHWVFLPFSLIVSHHLVTWSVVSCKKFTSSYRWEMTNATFFMRGIKNSKDPFPSLHSETQGKKTSLNNGWEKGLLRKESRCGMIELRGEKEREWGGGQRG